MYISLDVSCMGLSVLLGLDWLFPSHVWGVFYYTLFKSFLRPFLFLFFLWEPYNSNVGAFNIFQRSLKVKVKFLSHVRLFVTQWTIACQAPLSMGFSRQEYWNGLPFLSPGDLPNPGIEPRSPALQTGALPSEPPGNPERFLRLSSIHFILFPLLCCSEVISTILSSSSLINSTSVILLWFLLEYF